MDICRGILSNQTDQTKTKAFRIKALQPPNQNIVNVKEVLEQSVIQFSQVQIIYIYIILCTYSHCWSFNHHEMLSNHEIVSVSLALATFSPFLQVFFAWLSWWSFRLLQKMDWLCLTHSATYFFCKFPWAVFLLNWFFNGWTNQCPPLFIFCIFYLIS